jgi:uncharacterized repeat protein (TIGR03803 family)
MFRAHNQTEGPNWLSKHFLFGYLRQLWPTRLGAIGAWLEDFRNPSGGAVRAKKESDMRKLSWRRTISLVGVICALAVVGSAAETFTTLYSFCSQAECADGDAPAAGLVQATNGNFYGTTYYGGAHGDGTVFEITVGGKLTTLYSFCSKAECTDGTAPEAGLLQATNGNFYGTTSDYGTVYGDGTVFEITAGGELTTLYSFCSKAECTDGTAPEAGLLQATNGNLYGTTEAGGAHGYGTVFSLAVGLGPFVKTLPPSGNVGMAVIILGNDLTGATHVTFNGTPATFTVVSSSEIKTTVPRGATTGPVKVTTPIRTLTSNVNFRVS